MMIHELIIERDEDLRTCLDKYMLQMRFTHAYISGAVGSIRDVTLAAPAEMTIPPKLTLTHCEGPAEITSLVGDIYLRPLAPPDELFMDPENDSPLFAHIHMALAIAGGRTYGGGFRQGRAFRRIKLYVIDQSDNS